MNDLRLGSILMVLGFAIYMASNDKPPFVIISAIIGCVSGFILMIRHFERRRS